MSLDNLIDGRAIAKEVHAETDSRVVALKAGGVVPSLIFIRVGEDPASRVYVGMKERSAMKLGIRSETIVLPNETAEAELLDLVKQFNGNLSDAFKSSKAKFFVISFTSDWLYPTQENKEIVIALNAIGADVGFVEIESDKGHDAFLLDEPEFDDAMKGFIKSVSLEAKI